MPGFDVPTLIHFNPPRFQRQKCLGPFRATVRVLPLSERHSGSLRLYVVAIMRAALLAGCATSLERTKYKIRHQYPVDDPQFSRALGSLLGPALVPGNRVVTLVNGDQIFPAMLQAIGSAKRSVNLETYRRTSGGCSQCSRS